MKHVLSRSLHVLAFVLFLFGLLGLVGDEVSAQRFDVLIRGGLVIDGTGREPFAADVGIAGGRITAVEAPGKLSAEGASRTIDASGLYVSPGFIDLHSHAESGLSDPYLAGAANNLAQGITTVVVGQDGNHAWALGGSVGDQVALWRRQGVGTNVVPLAGQGSARFEVIGFGKEPATPEQQKAVAERVDELLQEGAWGLSSGLSYDPGRYSSPEEVVEAARPLAKHGGFYISHLRDQGDKLLPSIEETIDLGRKTGARVVVSHIKASGKRNWGKSKEAVELIRKARDEGLSVYADLYPYETSNDGIDVSLVPVRAVFGAEELRGFLAPAGANPADVIRWAFRMNPNLENRVEPDFLLQNPERGMAVALAASSWLEQQPIYRRRVRDVLHEPEKSKALLSFVEQLLQAPGGAELFEVTFHPEEKLIGKRLSEIADEY
ncbi:MAG: N-acyl-D-amino-acid deacylase family protein, partial [Vicinamibacteria bacterium]